MAKLDDLIEEYREDGREDDAAELEKLRGSGLRKQAEGAAKLEKERDELRTENEALKKGPKISKAFKDAGIDLDSLSKLERKAVEAYDGELDEEAIASFVEENELPLTEGAEGADDEKEAPPAAERVANAARRSGEGRGAKAPKITPDDAAQWTPDKAMAFGDEHPEEWEALKRGESVVGMTG